MTKFRILYKKGKTEKDFSKLEWVDKSGQEKPWISNFFEENLENMFPQLRLFLFRRDDGKEYTEYSFEGGRFDAVCWYPQKHTFIIFEYKSEELDDRGLGQIIRYFNNLQEKEIKHQFVWDLTKIYPKENGKRWETNDIKWNELKLILIASDFAKFRKGTIHDKIIKIMSQWYESNDEVVLSLESDEVKFLEKISETTINNQVADALPLNDKKNHAQIDIKQWAEKEKDWVISLDSLDLSHARGSRINHNIQSQKKNRVILTIYYYDNRNHVLAPPKIFLVNPSQKLIDRYKLQWKSKWGNDESFQYTINNNFKEARNLLSEFIEENKI